MVADRIGELDIQKTSRWERGEQMPNVASRAALVALWGQPPWEPGANGEFMREFSAWLAGHVEDAPALERLLSVLRLSPASAQASAPPLPAIVPRQLPMGTAHFVGRNAELARLSQALASDLAELPPTPVITAIDGTAGAGKTELVLHWAHQVRAHFPHGDLYVNLRGHDVNSPPLEALEALSGLLHALRVPADQVPAGLNERVGLYRSLLADQQMLIVLDNAHASEQVRPLLPGPGSRCTVVVTSRSQLSGLAVQEGLRRVTLGLLSPVDSLHLLRRVAGVARIDAELDAAQALVGHCARLPLALRIVADKVVLHPRLPLTALAHELADVSQRLNALTVWDAPHMHVKTVFSWSYLALSDQARRAFRLLGLAAGPHISLQAAAALLGSEPGFARCCLAELTSVHLLEATGVDAYQTHDLLRVYAAERAMADEPQAVRQQAVRRLLTWYLHSADAAGRTLLPRRPRCALGTSPQPSAPRVFASAQDASDWLEDERDNLVAALRQADASGEWRLAWELAVVLWDPFAYQNIYWRYAVLAEDIGLKAARLLQEIRAEAWMVGLRGVRLIDFNDAPDTAAECFHRLLELARQDRISWPVRLGGQLLSAEFGVQWGLGLALWGLGDVQRRGGQVDEALECYEQALAVLRKIGDKWMPVRVLMGLAAIRIGRGEGDAAQEHLNEALAFSRETGSRVGMAFCLRALGDMHRRLGPVQSAIDCYTQAVDILRELKETRNQAGILKSLGDLHEQLGQPVLAGKCHQKAALLFERLQLAAPATLAAGPAPELLSLQS
jgi:tetratricopeptide (TPR) repeat protein